MDDRFYLAVYDEERLKHYQNQQNQTNQTNQQNQQNQQNQTDQQNKQNQHISLLKKEDYVRNVVLPCYELCQAGEYQAIRRSRFSEVAGRLYQLDESLLPILDEIMSPELVRHQAMAADEERLYNVFVYVCEDES